MVYGLFYLPIELHHSLLAETHHFDDSKVLTPEVRTDLMRKLCTKGSDLYEAASRVTFAHTDAALTQGYRLSAFFATVIRIVVHILSSFFW